MAITGQIAASAHESTTQPSRLGESFLDRIGNTPLLRLERIASKFSHVEFYAKAEWFNPGGSVKDRPALNMIQAGLASGALKCGKAIIDATSGNTGIAYAMIGAAMGYPVKLCLPDSASHERKRILAAYGAELVITPGDEGTDGAIRRVHEIVAAEPDKYFTRINTAIPRIGKPTTAPPRTRSGSRFPAGSPISSQGWARAGRSLERRGA